MDRNVRRSPKRYFSVEEANRRLPLVRRIVADVVRQYGEVQQLQERMSRLTRAGRPSTGDPYSEEVAEMERELRKQVEKLKGYVDELGGLGVELKDPSVGLIDFPAKMDGRDVYLCWKMGEAEVLYWHDLDSGFAGRQPLTADSAAGHARELHEEF